MLLMTVMFVFLVEDSSPADELALLEQGLNRVTDTCIPEEAAIRVIEGHIMNLWKQASQNGDAALPHTYLYRLLLSGVVEADYQADPSNSWLLAAAESDSLPLYVPGWEDSTLGNIFAARCSQGAVDASVVLSGDDYMTSLMSFYRNNTAPLAFLQTGGGIAGDFPICVVPFCTRTWMNGMFRFGHGTPKSPMRLRPTEGIHRRTAKRKNHLGENRPGNATVQHTKRCEHCSAFVVRLHLACREAKDPKS